MKSAPIQDKNRRADALYVIVILYGSELFRFGKRFFCGDTGTHTQHLRDARCQTQRCEHYAYDGRADAYAVYDEELFKAFKDELGLALYENAKHQRHHRQRHDCDGPNEAVFIRFV